MSQKLPRISGLELIKLLKKLGYSIIRRKGSHIRLVNNTLSEEHKITVPFHKELAKGILNDILTEISFKNNISKEKLLEML